MFCAAQEDNQPIVADSLRESHSQNSDSLEIMNFYFSNQGNDGESKSTGTVSDGGLENGKLVPFYGVNFTYFDRESYLGARAFTNDKVRAIILDSYLNLHQEYPGRQFFLMELSNEHGGKISPHHTHQNGLSVDFMMPKIKNGQPYYGLDSLGKEHYLLDFNDNGELKKDTSIKVDFDLIVKHILILNDNAKKYNYKITKVIIKIEYKDELFSSAFGKELTQSGIYLVKNLSPIINAVHDDHFHVDFEKM